MKFHSISDIITNSSTELFVVPKKNEVTAEEFLEVMEPVWRVYRDKKLKIDKRWAEYYGVHEETSFKDLVDIFVASCGTRETWTDYQDRERVYYEYDEGDLIIKGAGDNLIPYALFNFIDEIFSARHYHLG